MIAHLKGQVLKKTDKGIILDTGNIGYFVHLTKNLISEINETTTINFFIHTHVKDDAQDLYGFATFEDLEFFKQLISINGIGPKVALEILNVEPSKMKSAIISEDEAFICQIPGIGKKTAKRLILELKEKLKGTKYEAGSHKTHAEALDALIKLGYQRHEVRKILSNVPPKITETEEIITYFLKNN